MRMTELEATQEELDRESSDQVLEDADRRARASIAAGRGDETLHALVFLYKERLRLRDALTSICQFANGHGDIGNQIAKTARHALYPELTS